VRQDAPVHPDWLGSPQHFIAGLALSVAIVWVVGRRGWPWWVVAALGVGVTMTAEVVVEIIEYPLLYSGDPHLSAYYDTVADLADTLAGAVLGALAGLVWMRIQQTRERRRGAVEPVRSRL
jgi:uncharacterized membrane protein YjdF